MRLPIPPPPRSGCYFLAGVGGAGTVVVVVDGAVVVDCWAPAGICNGTVTLPAGGCCWPGMLTGTGCDLGALVFAGVASNTELPNPALLVAKIDNDSDVIMNNTAEIVVSLERRVADPRGPKAVCEPIPPNAPARSAALPLCSSTTPIKNTHTIR